MSLPENGETVLVSSGGVLYRKRGREFEVCLIAKRAMKIWALPRGRVEPGETPEATAVREVREETGYTAQVGEKVDQIDFSFYSRIDDRMIHRVVHFYLMPWAEGEPGVRDPEVDTARWYPMEKAIQALRYDNEKEVLRKARRILNENKQLR